MKILLILTSFILNINIYAAEMYDPSDDLITAFGSTCSTQGSLSSAAMSQGASLRMIFNSIHNDPNCSSIAQALDGLDISLSNTIKGRSAAEQTLNTILRSIQDLKVQLAIELAATPPDQTKISAYQNELNNLEISLIRAKADPALSAHTNEGRAGSVNTIYENATTLMSSISDNNKCFQSHASLGPQITASTLQTLSLFAPSSMGAAYLMAIPGIVGHLLQTAQDLRISDNLKKTISARMVHAIGCSIEGISATYCQARDVNTILENQTKNPPQASCDLGLGITVMSKELNAFQNWASTIVAGSSATSTAQASTKIDGLTALNNFAGLKENINGFIGSAQRDLMGMKDEVMKKNRIQSLINDLAGKIIDNCDHAVFAGGSVTKGAMGPLFFDQCGVKAFILSGGTARTCSITNGQSPDDYLANKYPGANPSTAEISARISTILSEGGAYVAAQTASAIQSNPQLALAASEHMGLNNKTAVDFLRDSRAYLGNLLEKPDSIASGNNRRIVQDAYTRCDSILSKLDEAKNNPNNDPGSYVTDLAMQISPSGDLNLLGNEISAIVKSDIDSRIKNGKIDPSIASILQLSTSDSLNEYIGAQHDKNALRGQITESKVLTKSNLESFGSTFSDQIEDNLKDLLKQSEDDDDAKQTIGLMCARLAALPQAPKLRSLQSKFFGGKNEIDIGKYCKGQVFRGMDAKDNLKYDDVIKLKQTQRTCSVYDYFRGSRLKEMTEKSN